ncbi:hypothetical protein KAI68_04020, partial [bacterium]|nr:hypothetical protein [bacterium]
MIRKKAKIFVLITSLILMLFFLFNSTAIAEEGLVVIVVNSTLQPFIQSSLSLYVSDVEAEGYTVEVKSWNLAGSTPQELKDYLIAKQSNGLVGAFFVGDLPIANFYHANDFYGNAATFPSDLYYMNLDGVWTDSNSDGKFDTITGDRNPQIWLGRLVAGNLSLMGTEEDIVNNYFAKVHAYKTKTKQIQRRACSLIYKDWPSSWGLTMGNIYTDYETVAGDTFTTTTYTEKLNAGYEFIFLCAHSNAGGHSFNNGWFSNANIPVIDPDVWFYNLYACSNCRYTTSNYMGGCYVSSNEYGISAMGSTKTGSMLGFDYFTIPLGEEKSIGEAFKTWWVDYVNGRSTDSVISWHYGMTLLGDPVLKTKFTDVNYVKIRDAAGG